MGVKSDPFGEYPEWTTSKFFSFLRSGLRAKWTRWPPKYQVMAAAKRPYTGDNKRQKFEFQCNECREWFSQKNVSVDHLIPAGSLRSYADLPDFCERLFVGVDKLQVLCDGCHKIKTAQERADSKNKEELNDEHCNSDPEPRKSARQHRSPAPRKRVSRKSSGEDSK